MAENNESASSLLNKQIRIENRVFFPDSLGIFYQAMTQFLGFPHYGDEYKVMGMAAYGVPKFLDKMQELVFCHQDGTYKLNLKYFLHQVEPSQTTLPYREF